MLDEQLLEEAVRVDCLIAACALRHGLTVVHVDRDFDLIARVSPLQ